MNTALLWSAAAAWSLAAPAPIDDVVAEQIKMLSDDDKDVRLAAMTKLAELAAKESPPTGLAKAIPDLTRYLEDKNDNTRQLAVKAVAAISAIGKKAFPTILLKALDDPELNVRVAVLVHCRKFQSFPQEAVPLLIRALESSSYLAEYRVDAANALAIAGFKTQEVLRALESVAELGDEIVVHAAHNALQQLDPNLDRYLKYLSLRVYKEYKRDPNGEVVRNIAGFRDDDDDRLSTHLVDDRREQIAKLQNSNPRAFAIACLHLLDDKDAKVLLAAAHQIRLSSNENLKIKKLLLELKGEDQLRKHITKANRDDRRELTKALGALIYSPELVALTIKRLGTDQPKDVRMDALFDFRCMRQGLEDSTKFTSLMPVLAGCSGKQEPDAEMRDQCVWSFGLLAYDLKQPCPMVIVESMMEEKPSENTMSVFRIFSSFPAEAMPLMIRGVEHKNEFVRDAMVIALGDSGRKDKGILEALEKATTVRDTRHNAEVAIFKLSNDWTRYVKHYLRQMDDSSRLKQAPEGESIEEKEERLRECVVAQLSIHGFRSLQVKNAEDVIPVMVKLLSDPSPLIRKYAARSLGDAPQLGRKAKNWVEKLNAKAEIQKLLGDKDEEVRNEAKEALEKLGD